MRSGISIVMERLLSALGLRRLPRNVFALQGELAETLQILALEEQRPPDELAADLLASGLAQHDLQRDAWLRWASLSPREKQVATLALQGYTNRQIAQALTVSQDTVKSHVRRILFKFNLHSKDELCMLLGDWELKR